MKRWLFSILAGAGLLVLGGCAAPVVRSSVTTFYDGTAAPALSGQPYVFERTKTQDADLEYRNYENLVRGELQKLGLNEADTATKPKLTVKLDYGMRSRDVRVLQPTVVDPFFYGPVFYSSRWRRHNTASVFYDPFWNFPPSVQMVETRQVLYQRQLHLVMANLSDAKKMYDVTVNSEGTNSVLAAVMPAMVSSAFSGFPGQSGVPRRVDMEIKAEKESAVGK